MIARSLSFAQPCARAACRIVFVLSVLSGCASSVSMNTMLAGAEEKARMLEEQVMKFNRALYWGAYDEALAYVAPEVRQELVRRWKKKGTIKVVEQNVTDVVFNEGNDEAEVEVQVRYFKQPVYIVNTRTQQQKWRYYRMSGGWYLYQMEEKEGGADEDKAAAGGSSSRAASGR